MASERLQDREENEDQIPMETSVACMLFYKSYRTLQEGIPKEMRPFFDFIDRRMPDCSEDIVIGKGQVTEHGPMF